MELHRDKSRLKIQMWDREGRGGQRLGLVAFPLILTIKYTAAYKMAPPWERHQFKQIISGFKRLIDPSHVFVVNTAGFGEQKAELNNRVFVK